MIGSVEKKKKGYLMRVTVGYNHKGNPDRISKHSDATTEKEARLDLIKWIAELEKKGYDKPKNFKLERFIIDEWLPYAEKELAYKTYNNYVNTLKSRFIPILGNKQMSRITKIQIVKIMDNLKRIDGKKGHLSKSTKIDILSSLRHVFDYAAYLDVITENVATEIRIGQDERTEEEIKTYRPYSTKEIAHIFACLADEPIRLQAIIATALVTGARKGEIAALETRHINKKNQTLTFTQTVVDKKGIGAVVQPFTKTKVVKVVHVPENLIDLLERVVEETVTDFNYDVSNVVELKKESEYIFKGVEPGKASRADSLYKSWKRFCKRHDIRFIRFHDLRHTSATYLLSQTGNLKAVQERLGHKDYLTTANFYAHVLEETDRESSAVFDKFLQQK